MSNRNHGTLARHDTSGNWRKRCIEFVSHLLFDQNLVSWPLRRCFYFIPFIGVVFVVLLDFRVTFLDIFSVTTWLYR